MTPHSGFTIKSSVQPETTCKVVAGTIRQAQIGSAEIPRSAIEGDLPGLDTNASEEDYLQLFLLTGNKLSYIKSNP